MAKQRIKKNSNNKSKSLKNQSKSSSSASSTRAKDVSSTQNSKRKQKSNSSKKMNDVIAKKRNVRRTKKRPVERWFWITLLVLFVVISTAGIYYIFKDYYKDSSTPSQKAIEDISDVDVEYFESLSETSELIESVKVTPQGPIVYTIYTVVENTPRGDALKAVNETFTKAVSEKPEIFDVYDFEITVVNSGKEAEGVNDYPVAGSKNVGVPLKWMDMEGTFVAPVEEITDETEEEGSE